MSLRNSILDWVVASGLLDCWRGRPGRIGRLVKDADVRWVRKWQ